MLSKDYYNPVYFFHRIRAFMQETAACSQFRAMVYGARRLNVEISEGCLYTGLDSCNWYSQSKLILPSLKPSTCASLSTDNPCKEVSGGRIVMLTGLYLVALGVGGIKAPPNGAEQFDTS